MNAVSLRTRDTANGIGTRPQRSSKIYTLLLLVLALSLTNPLSVNAQQTGIVYIGPDSLNSTSVPYFVNPDGSGNRLIAVHLVGVFSPKWSRNAGLIAAQGTPITSNATSDIYTFDRAGGSLQRVTNFNISGYSVELLFSSFSGNGKKLAVVAWQQRTSDGAQCVTAYVYSVSGTLLTIIGGGCSTPGTGNGNAGFGIDWSPKADLLVLPFDAVVQCSPTLFLPVTEVLAIPPVANPQGTPVTHPNPCIDPSTQTFDVWPVFSPDGAKVAFVRWFQQGGANVATTIGVVNLDGTNERHLITFTGEQTLGISWSGDGTKLLFDRGQVVGGVVNAGSLGLWAINVNGTGLVRVKAPTAYVPSWSWVNPAPVLRSITPNSIKAHSPSFTLTTNGSNFVKGAVVRWNGSNRTTVFVSSNQLKATILASDVAVAGTAHVSVFNPAPGGGVSASVTFTITP